MHLCMVVCMQWGVAVLDLSPESLLNSSSSCSLKRPDFRQTLFNSACVHITDAPLNAAANQEQFVMQIIKLLLNSALVAINCWN